MIFPNILRQQIATGLWRHKLTIVYIVSGKAEENTQFLQTFPQRGEGVDLLSANVVDKVFFYNTAKSETKNLFLSSLTVNARRRGVSGLRYVSQKQFFTTFLAVRLAGCTLHIPQ